MFTTHTDSHPCPPKPLRLPGVAFPGETNPPFVLRPLWFTTDAVTPRTIDAEVPVVQHQRKGHPTEALGSITTQCAALHHGLHVVFDAVQ